MISPRFFLKNRGQIAENVFGRLMVLAFSQKDYTPFTTFPLFLLLFSLFFSLSSPPSSTVGEKLPLFTRCGSYNGYDHTMTTQKRKFFTHCG